jgi:hypothetical protein
MLTLKQLKTMRDKHEFLKVKNFYSDKQVLMIVSYKGTGKSYGAMEECIVCLEKGEEFAWIRNTKEELEKSDVIASFTRIMLDMNILDKYRVDIQGIYRLCPENKKGIKVACFVYMSRSGNFASQNALNHLTLIVYDEFINPTFIKKNLFIDLFALTNTLGRTNIPRLILLGNK